MDAAAEELFICNVSVVRQFLSSYFQASHHEGLTYETGPFQELLLGESQWLGTKVNVELTCFE